MKVYSVVAVDDEGPALRRIEKLTNQHKRLKLVGLAKTSDEARNLVVQYNPDILLLDIQLKESTSFDLLKTLPGKFDGTIVFITAYDKYAIKAFEFGAVDYLLKPFTEERFALTIERILERTDKKGISEILALLNRQDPIIKNTSKGQGEKTIFIKSGSQVHRVNVNSILYLEKEGNYMVFHTLEKKIICRLNMKDIFELVSENDFIRVHKSFLVNIVHISIIDTHVVLIGKKKIPIGRMYKENLLKLIDKKVI